MWLVALLPGRAERLGVLSEAPGAVGVKRGEVGFVAWIDVRDRPDEASYEV
jgi:hypothetical protein